MNAAYNKLDIIKLVINYKINKTYVVHQLIIGLILFAGSLWIYLSSELVILGIQFLAWLKSLIGILGMVLGMFVSIASVIKLSSKDSVGILITKDELIVEMIAKKFNLNRSEITGISELITKQEKSPILRKINKYSGNYPYFFINTSRQSLLWANNLRINAGALEGDIKSVHKNIQDWYDDKIQL